MIRSLSILSAIPLLVACSDFYSTNVVGFVKRERVAPDGDGAVAGPGVNDVDVRIYLSEPSSFDDMSFVAETVTAQNRAQGAPGQDGYYNHRIAWEADGEFGQDGDTLPVWIATSHADYESRVARFSSVLSGTVNLVPDVLLTPTDVGPDLVTGRVLLSGAGQDGVQVVLALEGDDEPSEYTALTGVTASETSRAGVYEFFDVRWPGDPDESREATLRVVDHEFVGDRELRVEIFPDKVIELDEPIEVRSSLFSAPSIRGRVVDSLGEGVDGVAVALTVEPGEELERSFATVTSTVEDERGVYRFEALSWSIAADALENFTGVRSISLEVVDERYRQTTAAGEPLQLSVAEGQELHVGQDILVERKRREMFSARLEGRCVTPRPDGVGEPLALAGVEVGLSYEDDAGTHTLSDLTDSAGHYSFALEWARKDPSPDAPSGEDALDSVVSFGDLKLGADIYQFEAIPHVIRSWIAPNTVANAVGSVAAP